MKLVVTGAGGRMGQSLIRAINDNPQTQLHAALEHELSPHLGKDSGEMSGIGVNGIKISDDALTAIVGAQGIVDFSTPAASVAFSALAAQARIVHVIGTTGMSEADQTQLAAASRHAPIVKSGNMSMGVILLATLVKQAAKVLQADDFDLEVLEMHHKYKVDAPSGTALLLGEAAADGRGIDLQDNAVMSREGHTGVRQTGTIGFATLRGGSVVGEHSVLLAGDGETLTLSHKASDRGIFAKGALKAALWGNGKKPGLYTMENVLGLS